MLQNLPAYLSVTFILTTLVTLLLFYRAVSQSKLVSTQRKGIPILLGLTGWLLLQAVLTRNGVYNSDATALPPKLALFGILPAILAIVTTGVTSAGRRFMNSLPLTNITYLNTVRIMVELVLYGLYLHKAVPELITFEGRNFDVFSGLTAPFGGLFWPDKRQAQPTSCTGLERPLSGAFTECSSVRPLIDTVTHTAIRFRSAKPCHSQFPV